MRVRQSELNLKRFEVEAMSQKVEALQQMINEFDQMASELERQITAEEERTGIQDPSHFTYSTFARSAAKRQANLLDSIADLKAKLEKAIGERDELLAELDHADAANKKCEDDSILAWK